MAFVVDASVAIAWFLPSQATAYTTRLLNRGMGEVLHAPAIWPLEFANALWGHQSRELLAAEQVDAIVDQSERLGVEFDRVNVSISRILQLARNHGLSSYDASYLELAIRLRLPLATKDGPLREAVKRARVPLAGSAGGDR